MIQKSLSTNGNKLKDFETKLMVIKGKVLGGRLGIKMRGWDWHTHATIYTIAG